MDSITIFSFCDVCSAACRSKSWGVDGALEQQRQDSHVCQGNRTFRLILRKNQNLYYKDDKVSCKKLRISNGILDM